MEDPVEALILDLLEWLATRSRPYAEVMDAWRTSCPRLPVWEEACGRGFIRFVHQPGQAQRVALTELGLIHVARQRPAGIHAGAVGADQALRAG